MFDEYGCGCIVSVQQGRVRFCAQHRIERKAGSELLKPRAPTGKIVKQYPANGEKP